MAKKNPHKEPDSAAVRNARSKANRIAAGICRNSSKHGKAEKGELCLRCWALPRAKKQGTTVDEVMSIERDRMEREAANENTSPGLEANVTANVGGAS